MLRWHSETKASTRTRPESSKDAAAAARAADAPSVRHCAAFAARAAAESASRVDTVADVSFSSIPPMTFPARWSLNARRNAETTPSARRLAFSAAVGKSGASSRSQKSDTRIPRAPVLS